MVYERSVGDVDEETKKRERSDPDGFRSNLRYEKALKGFAAKLSPRQVERLQDDPEVDFVTPDRQVRATALAPLATGEPTPPTGIRRIEAATATAARGASGAGVAVLDTGIDLDHSDLNASNGTNCIDPGAQAEDDNGHGTHVAGTIGGENDGSGVVGVAPGTKLHAVKVLDGQGGGTTSSVICGIDWVTEHASELDIKVANMSLAGGGPPVEDCSTTTDAEHKAICNSTDAGVTYVVAAGNDRWDFDYAASPDTPAAFPEVLTVTAASDSDGKGGATGSAPTCTSGESDDKYASFSNYAATSAGAAHTIAAPGVCISSTALGGGTRKMSGTSMAAPHMAGAVALCLDEAGQSGPCSRLKPSGIVEKMRADAESHTRASSTYGFAGDPTRPVSGRYLGYMGWANSAASTVGDGVAPTVSSVSPSGDAIGVSERANVSVLFSEPMDRASVQAAFSLTAAGQTTPVAGTFAWSGNTMTFDPSPTLAQGKTYTGRIGTGGRDASGKALATEKAWRFTTKDFSDAQVRQTGSSRATSATSPPRLNSDNNVFYQLNSTSSGTRTTAWYGRFLGVPSGLRDLSVTYKGKNSASCAQTLAVWDWTANSGSGAWLTLDSRSVGTTEVGISKTPSGTLARFVGGPSGDELRVQVRCTRGSSFYSSGDLLEIAHGPVPEPVPTSTVRTQDFTTDPGWDGRNNRLRPQSCPTVRQDFGYRGGTTYAGDAPGEVGGRIARTYHPAHYGKRLDPRKTLDQSLSATGTLYVRELLPGGSSGAFFGFFGSTAQDWRTPNTLGFRLSDSREHEGDVAIGLEYGTQAYSTAQGFVGATATTTDPDEGTFPFKVGQRYSWRLDYDPAANGGRGQVTFSVEGAGKPVVLDLPEEHRAEGAVFDSFGMLNQMIELGGGMKAYFDDLTIDGAPQPLVADPGWDGRGNVVEQPDCAVQDAHDFGWTAGDLDGSSGGKAGGLAWRTKEGLPELGAFYGDRIEPLSLEQELAASGTVRMERGSSDSGLYFGWFNEDSHGWVDGDEVAKVPTNLLGAMLEGPSRAGWYFRPAYGASDHTYARSSSGPRIQPDDVRKWSVRYDPDAGSDGRITVELDGEKEVLDVSAEARAAGATFDRFGIKSMEKGGHAQTVYFDDLSYTAAPTDSSVFSPLP